MTTSFPEPPVTMKTPSNQKLKKKQRSSLPSASSSASSSSKNFKQPTLDGFLLNCTPSSSNKRRASFAGKDGFSIETMHKQDEIVKSFPEKQQHSFQALKKPKKMVVESDDDDDGETLKDSTIKLEKTLDVSASNKNHTPFTNSSNKHLTPFTNTSNKNHTPSPLYQQSSLLQTGSEKRKIRIDRFNQANQQKYWFLEPDKIRDANKRSIDHPEYDPRTVYIPPEFWSKHASPFEYQYWQIKCKHFDSIVFFKKGKFFELFGSDADLGKRLFDLKLTDRGSMRMVGVPEKSFDYWAGKFVAKGYKVAKVDQLESELGKQLRERGADRDLLSASASATNANAGKIIRRELTSILTAGTLLDSSFLTGDHRNFCLALKQQQQSDIGGGGGECAAFGLAWVDVSTFDFFISRICCDDIDSALARLETMLLQSRPTELLIERQNLGDKTLALLNRLNLITTTTTTAAAGSEARDSTKASRMLNQLVPGEEFWSADKVREIFGLFEDVTAAAAAVKVVGSGSQQLSSNTQPIILPESIKQLLLSNNQQSNSFTYQQQIGVDLSLSSLGALIWYLQSLKLISVDRKADSQHSLLSLGTFHLVSDPLDGESGDDDLGNQAFLVLDGQTIGNLELFTTAGSSANASMDGLSGSNVSAPQPGSLFWLIDHCRTAFGRRLFKQWVCRPLGNRREIEKRLDSVEMLIAAAGGAGSHSDSLLQLVSGLGKLPDLERLISRANSSNLKLKDFLSVIDGFESMSNIMLDLSKIFPNTNNANRFQILLAKFPGDKIRDCLLEIKNSFNLDKARLENEFEIKTGVEPDFDQVCSELDQLLAQFDQHLSEQRKFFGSSSIQYKHLGKEIYQLEVPQRLVSKVPNTWQKRSGTKTLSRYYSPFITEQVPRYQQTLELKNLMLNQLFTRVLERFSKYHHQVWRVAVGVCAEIDCLLCLAQISGAALHTTRHQQRNQAFCSQMCRPEFVDWKANGEKAMFHCEQLTNPCVAASLSSTDRQFIPNDVYLGGDLEQSRENLGDLILLTGPNMGGKSTMLRQVCLAIILAQLGCFVPAKKCRMTVFDRLFTRIGANDNILAGQSTFMVELSETAKIIKHATARSLVILDELGRGTSTFDGYAIAYSVLAHLSSSRSNCLGLFSTHYAFLTKEFKRMKSVRCMHMDCRVDENHRRVVFLYKLIDGISPRSYGMNVASMAGIPAKVIDMAVAKSAVMEKHNSKGWSGSVGIGASGDSSNAAAESSSSPKLDQQQQQSDLSRRPGLDLLVQNQLANLLASTRIDRASENPESSQSPQFFASLAKTLLCSKFRYPNK